MNLINKKICILLKKIGIWKMSYIEKIRKNKDKYLSCYLSGKDYSNWYMALEREVYDKLIYASSLFVKLNKYIYENHFMNLLEYLEIDIPWIHDAILENYKHTKFEDSNFISRWDFYVWEDWVKIVETNHDTPWWISVLNILSENVWNECFDPNENVIDYYLKWLKQLGDIKTVFILWSMANRETYLLLSYMKEIFWFIWLECYTWVLEQLVVKNNIVYYNWKKIDLLFKYYPIDWLYLDYNMKLFEDAENAWKLKIVNPAVSYAFQLKSYFSFLWEHIDEFDDEIWEIIESIIPLSIRMDSMTSDDINNIIEEKNDRLLKDINNREWTNVYLWIETGSEKWISLVHSIKLSKNYIIQKNIFPVINNWFYTNFWIFNIRNQYAWIYIRMHRKLKTTLSDSILVWLWVKK